MAGEKTCGIRWTWTYDHDLRRVLTGDVIYRNPDGAVGWAEITSLLDRPEAEVRTLLRAALLAVVGSHEPISQRAIHYPMIEQEIEEVAI